MADNIRATPQNPYTGALARGLRSLQQLAGQYQVDPRIPLLGGTSVDELLSLPGAASLLEDVSYNGPRALIRGGNVATGGIGTFRLDPRVADVADVAMNVTPLAAMAGKTATRGAMAAGRAGERLAERVVPQVMERGGIGAQLMQDMATGSRSQVVKPKGGNWLAGSVERAIEPMKRADPGRMTEEQLLRGAWENTRPLSESEQSMNRWLETKLGKYMRNEMATPEDPIRALAERGVLHYDPTPTSYSVSKQRIAAGFPEEGMAQSDLAKRWEKRADTFFNELQASDLTRGYPELVEKDPWLAKVPPETRVYELLGGANEELGMQHLVDELKNAINPTSGLPENLLWKYQDLEKVTVPQAVQRVADINAWRAAQKAEADAARAMNPATHVFKEYPEHGFKWVELKAPKETGKKVARTKSAEELEMAGEGIETMSHDDIVSMTRDMARDEGIRPGTQEFNDMLQENIRMFGVKPSEMDESVKALEDALKYEGETMGHCVGGYCPDVLEGRSRIFSLRDKKGQPHVTIEVAPGRFEDLPEMEQFNLMRKARDELGIPNSSTSKQSMNAVSARARELAGDIPSEIVQIKGKANRAPNPEYLPAVQDFVRSGKWSRVGDLQNTGLYRKSDFIDEFKPEQLDAIGRGEYVTMDEIKKLREGKSWKPIDTDPDLDIDVSGFAEGGLVGSNIYNSDAMQDPREAYRFADGGNAGDVYQYAEGGVVGNFPTYDFDPARIDSIVGELHAMNAG